MRTYLDAPPTLAITLTEDDLLMGRPGYAENCAIARAACRALGAELGQVSVVDTIWLWNGHQSAVYALDEAGLRARREFDYGRLALPCSFTATRLEVGDAE